MLTMKLQWLILSTLFVHNSWAYSLYDEIDDDNLWRRQTSPSTENEKKPECKKDILVLWDNSNSIAKYRDDVFNFIKKFIRSKDLNVGKDGTHLGFITFSGPPSDGPRYVRKGGSKKDRTRVLLKVGEITDPEKIINNLAQYDYFFDLSGKKTYTGTAFKLALKQFSERSPHNHRDGIDDVILLFTDGRPNPDLLKKKRRNKSKDQTKPANDISRILKEEKNITIVGLAGGTEQNIAQFRDYINTWASPKLVFESKLPELDNVIDELIAASCKARTKPCGCEGNSSTVQYVKDRDNKLLFKWKKPKLNCGDGVIIPEPKVIPAGAKSPMEFGKGPHSITYTFSPSSGDKKRPNVKCSVSVDIGVCNCPPLGTIRGVVQQGDSRAFLSWSKPLPQPCDSVPSPSNPRRTSGWFSAGEHTLTYTYTHSTDLHSYTMQCPVNIHVTGQFCGGIAYNPDSHICCCGKAKKKTFGSHCCGQENYNPDEKVCCPNDSLVSFGGNCS